MGNNSLLPWFCVGCKFILENMYPVDNGRLLIGLFGLGLDHVEYSTTDETVIDLVVNLNWAPGQEIARGVKSVSLHFLLLTLSK